MDLDEFDQAIDLVDALMHNAGALSNLGDPKSIIPTCTRAIELLEILQRNHPNPELPGDLAAARFQLALAQYDLDRNPETSDKVKETMRDLERETEKSERTLLEKNMENAKIALKERHLI